MKMDLDDNKVKVKDYAEYLVRLGNLENVFAFLNDYCKDINHEGLKDIDLNESRFNYQKQQFFQGKITREAYDIQQRIIAEAIRAWIDEYLLEDDVWNNSKYSESRIKLSLADLKKQLIEILNLNGPEVIFFYLDELISEIKSVYEYQAIKRKYQILEWKSSNQRVYSQPTYEYAVKEIDTILREEREKREKLSEDRRAINDDLVVLIESLDDKDLITHWKSAYVDLKNNYRLNEYSRPRNILISSLDIIQIPKYLKENTDYQAYKRLMIRAQDEYLVGNYKRAHDLCIKVRDEVDPESAQLYEYLFASYYNWVGPEKVISDALQDSHNEKHLDKLFLYSGRFVRLQSIVSTRDESVKDAAIENNGEKEDRYMPRGANKIAREVTDVHSQTGEENIKEINSELLLTLADRYTKIIDRFRKDAIELDQEDKQKIIRCVLIAKSITENIRVDAVFATTVVNELAGGGKHQWIAIKKDGSLKNTEKNFDAIGHFEDAIRLLAFDKNKDEDYIKDELSYEVFNNLSEKYSYIKVAFEDNRLTEEDARLLLTRLLVSFRVATQLFPQSDQFFAIPVRELGSDVSILNWYRLSYNKVLIPIKNDKYKHYFDALKFYQFFLTANQESNLPFNWRREKEALVEKYYKVRSLHSKKLYELVETSSSYLVIDAKKEKVENIVNAYTSWKICFDVHNEQEYLRNCYQEIVGGEHFFWFVFDSRYIRGYSILKKFGIDFSPNAELDFLIKNMEGISIREAEKEILSNYCKKYVEPRVSEIKSITKYDSRPSFRYKLEVFNYIEQIMLLLRRTGSVESVDAFLYKELVKENTFRWFDVVGGELNNVEYMDHVKLDALSIAKELINISPSFALSDVMLKVMDNRLEDIQRDYHYSFHRIQRFNYEVGDILRMIEIIEKLVGYYRISKDVKYLQIPYLELEEGNGKIRWCNYGLYVHSLKPLNYEIGRIRPRTLIRGVSKFRFTKLRHFVRDEYKKLRSPDNQL